MQDSAKYLIHADVRASGVVERSDVVGAIFGQTEGLLGEDLDLRDLQESSKVGRIDVKIESEGGRSFGTATIASGLDKVETAVLAAGLETIDRIGPCRAEFEVTELEDARAAKRREVVERATELLADFEESSLSSRELVEEVRQGVRVADITEYEDLPAGPRVAASDAIVVVEGRADVLTLLRYGIKNAIAVEGTNVPDAVAELTQDRTVTAFLDGDRGGDLILKELAQVGSVDYVTFAPADRSVEDLSRRDVLSALRKKQPHEQLRDQDDGSGSSAAVATDGATTDGSVTEGEVATEQPTPVIRRVSSADVSSTEEAGGSATRESDASATGAATDGEKATDDSQPETIAGHVEAVVGEHTGRVRLLDETLSVLAEDPVEEAFESVESASPTPTTVVLDGELTQRLLDVAAQRGVGQIIARSEGEFVKQPTNVRVRTAD